MIDSNLKETIEGILLVDKPKGCSSFSLIPFLRKRLNVQKIGHAGTLDPFATGILVFLIGRRYTRLSNQFLGSDKEYLAKVYLGKTTDTYDCDGKIVKESSYVPSEDELQQVLKFFQGEIEQIPPMFSAKKQQGKKLYELARQGIDVPRKPSKVYLTTKLISYNYPYVELYVSCSKGTYIRSVAYECGLKLGCGGHLVELQRTRSGHFHLDECISDTDLRSPSFNLVDQLRTIEL